MNLTFIVGCARSGTSILGELIASHPDVEYLFEAKSVWDLGGLGENDSHRLTAAHATPVVSSETRKWFQDHANNAPMVVEKSPRNVLRIPYLRTIFPDAKCIHIVRDGRDVSCSMVPGCGEGHWSHLKPPSWKKLFLDYTGPVRCAMAWKEILEIGLNDLPGGSFLQIRYEDLVRQPHRVAEEILHYMDLRLLPEVTEFCGRIANETTGGYHAKHQDHWYRNDHRERIGRWRENLTAIEQVEISRILGPLLSRLGYSPELTSP